MFCRIKEFKNSEIPYFFFFLFFLEKFNMICTGKMQRQFLLSFCLSVSDVLVSLIYYNLCPFLWSLLCGLSERLKYENPILISCLVPFTFLPSCQRNLDYQDVSNEGPVKFFMLVDATHDEIYSKFI